MSELENVKVGDRLAVFQYGSTQGIVTVTRITKTQIIIHNGLGEVKYKKDTGLRVGDDRGFYGKLGILTQEAKDEIERRQLIRKIKESSYKNVSLENLRKIVEIMESDQNV